MYRVILVTVDQSRREVQHFLIEIYYSLSNLKCYNELVNPVKSWERNAKSNLDLLSGSLEEIDLHWGLWKFCSHSQARLLLVKSVVQQFVGGFVNQFVDMDFKL